VELVHIYSCLCEPLRLRILCLLAEKPLCVGHLQEVLAERQANISKHLSYLKSRGVVVDRREGPWRVYRIRQPVCPALAVNLACLADHANTDPVFRQDAAKLQRLLARPSSGPSGKTGLPSSP
jgi:ArsR family transcriptional regulator